MLVPGILHQTWKSHELPETFRDFRETWVCTHPTWECRLTDDRENRIFIRDSYPWFLQTYDAYNFEIQRVDSVRYFLLYHFGGVYADLDVQCLRSLSDLLESKEQENSLILGLECTDFVSNAVMISSAHHPFWELVFAELQVKIGKTDIHFNGSAIWTTGPVFLQSCVDKWIRMEKSGTNPIRILQPEAFSPRAYMHRPQWGIVDRNLHPNSYTLHHWAGSWVGNEQHERVKNKPTVRILRSRRKIKRRRRRKHR